ncbi:unnamed protein product, partial [Didymodactylos carnosus]
TLKSNEITEVVNLDIRSQIQAIIRRNKHVLSRQELFPKSDVCYGEHYQTTSAQKSNPITIILHSDGASLIRTSKQALWPVFASIVEIPPPVREYQKNIIVVALWSSKKKPNVNIFLEECVRELKYLMIVGTSIFVDDEEFNVVLSTQYFVSDLPAKSCSAIQSVLTDTMLVRAVVLKVKRFKY